ncbi:MAG: dicarboxylate/amino acid:cation symporter [Flavobacteriaceae bacterium]|nr:dicarboxylate/amino acid:cation symporter [Flavobacteriaceae bacterium]
MRKLDLHWKILIGMVLGIIFGFIAAELNWNQFVINWIKPFGTVFINMLKMIAVPLIIVSLITGIAELKDISRISKMGGKTIFLYLVTTMFAVSVGLILANVIKPGNFIDEAARDQLMAQYTTDAGSKIQEAQMQKEQGPLQPIVDIVPDNFFSALTDNGKMLQVIFFSILIGIGLILIPEEKAKPVTSFFVGFNEVILKIIDITMLLAPIGVFALLSAILVEIPSFSVLQALLVYAFTVIAGLLILILIFYSSLVTFITKNSYFSFLRAIAPAQLVAFSTSSSAATLPVTMERVTEHLGVDEEVSSFVLPLGATINMDGTSLYQSVAAIFIAQAFGMNLDLPTQLMIIITATLASIGSAAVPSAGMVMLVIVLGQAGIPEAGLALIFAIDRPLDMCRTVVNITSDATVATIIAKTEGLLNNPKVKNWDDHYPTNNG